MKIAYLVIAHNNPKLLKRTAGRLSSEDSTVFIHIDRKTDLKQFSGISGGNVLLTETRVPVYWAETSMVEATILLLQQALRHPNHFDYFILLSGADYPLRCARYIHQFLEQNRGQEYMSLVKVPGPGKPLSTMNTLRFPSNQPVRRFVFRALAKLGMAQRDYRKYLENLEPYAGSTWWALTRDACQYILEFLERNPHVTAYFQNVFCPDESLFHTILGNSVFAPRIRRNLLYEDWSARGPHPAPITERHVVLLEAQEKICVSDVYGSGEVLFARKFSDESFAVLQKVDNMIHRERSITCAP
jgi:hypothetical protein